MLTGTQFLSKGQIIIREGSRSDFAFVIEDGQFAVSRKRIDGKIEVLDILEKNDIFGEIGLIDGNPRSATVTALKNGRVKILTQEDLNLILEKNPRAILPILKALSTKLRKSNHPRQALTQRKRAVG